MARSPTTELTSVRGQVDDGRFAGDRDGLGNAGGTHLEVDRLGLTDEDGDVGDRLALRIRRASP